MNKYLILEILAYAQEFPQAVEILCVSSKTLRRLMITNLQASLAIFEIRKVRLEISQVKQMFQSGVQKHCDITFRLDNYNKTTEIQALC